MGNSFCCVIRMNAHRSLIDAVREGRVEEVRQFICSRGLSSLPTGSGGYFLLREALYIHQIAVAKLLIASGSKVNSRSLKLTDTPLHLAIRNGDEEVVEMLLNRGADVNAKNQYGTTPLHEAAEGQKMEVVEFLLKSGANVDAADNSGRRPLHVAAEMGNPCIVGSLLKNGASVNCELTSSWSKGTTPLHLAVESGNGEVVALLLSGGAHVDDKEQDGKTPLHIAAQRGYKRIAEQLINHGASTQSVSLKQYYIHGYGFLGGYMPLHLASGFGRERVVKLLLNRGADVNASTKDNLTPLHIALRRGHEKVVSLLLEHGAKVDIQDKDGKTALRLAVENRGSLVIVEEVLKCCPDVNNESNRSCLKTAVLHYRNTYRDIVEALLKYGLRVDSKDANNSQLFHAAVEKGYLKIVEDLLKCGADVDMSKNGFAPLHVAAQSKQEEVAKLLLIHKADINAKCKTGKPPLYYAIEKADLKTTRLLLTNGADVKNNSELLVTTAVKKGYTNIVEILLQHDVDVNAGDEYGRTPLHYTARASYYRYEHVDPGIRGEIAKLLLNYGANVHAQDENGETTLHAASYEGFAEVVEAVLGQGADVNAQLKDGITALHIASERGHQQVVKVLLDYGAKVDSKMKSDLQTLLHVAAENCHQEVVKVLLEYGAKVDSKMKSYLQTLLHGAAENGYPEIIEILLNFGADADAKDGQGRTALHIASRKGLSKVVETLLEYGADVNITTKRNQTPLEQAIAVIGAFNDMYPGLVYYRSNGEPTCDVMRQPMAFRILRSAVTAGVLENHIVKMKTANLYVSQTNLLSLRDSLKLHYFQNDCEEEIVTMKSEMMNDTNISVYDILAKPHSLPAYMRNENIVQVFKTRYCKTKFPIYASMIDINFRKGMERKDLLDRGHGISHFLYENFPEVDDFPDECTEKIFSYLSNEDLRILIDVCESRPQHQ